MDPSLMGLIPLDHPDANDSQYELLKSMSEYFMYASVPKTKWSGHLKRLWDFYEAIYSCIDSILRGHSVFFKYLM